MICSNVAGRLAAPVALALAPSTAMAGNDSLGQRVIRQPQARATPGGAQVVGGYLTVENKATTPARLMGPLEIPVGESVTLAPAGIHIMFDGLIPAVENADTFPTGHAARAAVRIRAGQRSKPLTAGMRRGLETGEAVPGTLTFEHAGSVPVAFEVEGVSAKRPGVASKAAHAGPAMPGMGMD